MRAHLDAPNQAMRDRLCQLLDFNLAAVVHELAEIRVSVCVVFDAANTELLHCRVSALTRRRHPIEIEEIQSSLDLAATRALERTARAIRRQRNTPRHRYSA